MNFKFFKTHGLGNDFVVFFNQDLKISTKLISFLSNRKKGIGCDLVVFVKESKNNYSDLVARFFNADGSEAEICGNALRCIGKYYFKNNRKKNISIETNSGLIDVEKYNENMIAVDLGRPKKKWNEIPISMDINPQNLGIKLKYLEGGLSVNIGNPHVIFFVTELTKKKLEEDSKKIINGNLFPEGVNVSAVKVISRNEIKVMTFERGVGLTDACGSGASASVFASCKMNYCDTKVKVSMVGGDLDVEITKDEHILIVGDAMEVFEGNVNLEEFV